MPPHISLGAPAEGRPRGGGARALAWRARPPSPRLARRRRPLMFAPPPPLPKLPPVAHRLAWTARPAHTCAARAPAMRAAPSALPPPKHPFCQVTLQGLLPPTAAAKLGAVRCLSYSFLRQAPKPRGKHASHTMQQARGLEFTEEGRGCYGPKACTVSMGAAPHWSARQTKESKAESTSPGQVAARSPATTRSCLRCKHTCASTPCLGQRGRQRRLRAANPHAVQARVYACRSDDA
ncbi:MAG: hypothetical protein J3K34DRAFT_415275 [Monoraphidium minutum]|nr:MAG: hypothetical protein J3K34DRAFT_415275 [Monoraphidium minutum]